MHGPWMTPTPTAGCGAAPGPDLLEVGREARGEGFSAHRQGLRDADPLVAPGRRFGALAHSRLLPGPAAAVEIADFDVGLDVLRRALGQEHGPRLDPLALRSVEPGAGLAAPVPVSAKPRAQGHLRQPGPQGTRQQAPGP